MTDLICIGAVAGAFGVRGDVRVKSFTAQPEDIATYGALSTEDGSRTFTITLTGQIKIGHQRPPRHRPSTILPPISLQRSP